MLSSTIAAVLPSVAGKITEGFIQRKRTKIAITELQDQVVQLLASNRQLQIEAQETRLAVLALARYLAMTQAEVFALRDGQLALASAARDNASQKIAIESAIHNFSSRVESHPQSRRQQLIPARTPTPTPAKAPRDFIDGFNEEVMRARTGAPSAQERE